VFIYGPHIDRELIFFVDFVNELLRIFSVEEKLNQVIDKITVILDL